MAKVARVWDGSSWVIISPAAVNPYPSLTGNSGKVLSTDGSTASWADTAFTWDAINSHWTSEESINLGSGSVLKIGGTPTLSSTNYIGNSATVTNGLYSTGSYSDPSWIVELSWSKLINTPTTLSGYGLTDYAGIKSDLSLDLVENVELSSWTGSTFIHTLGTITTGQWTASVIDESYIDSSIARLSSPTFTDIVVLPSTTSIGTVDSAEISYLDGVTSSIQTQLNGKLDSSLASTTYAPLDSPIFTTSASLPSSTSIGTVTSTEISYLSGVTSAIQSQIDLKASIESPTFTGTVSGISKSMVGLANVDNTSDANKPVSTAQQAALDDKASLSGDTFTGFITLHADPTQALHAATKEYVDNAISGIDWHKAVNLFSDSNVSLTGTSGTLVIDGHSALDQTDDGLYRILLTGQTTDSENGIYLYGDDGSSYTLSRSDDANNYAELVGSAVFVLEGTVYAGTSWIQTSHYLTDFSGQVWSQFSGSGTVTAGTNISVTGLQISTVNNPTFSGLVTASSGVAFSDGTQTKVGVPSISSFISKTSSYTLDDLALRDNIIEVDSTSATTITIPTDASLNFPVGASIDVFQINTGEVTIAGDAGVTVNSTPGLKLRTRWSSCTLLKRGADSWIVYGDLKA